MESNLISFILNNENESFIDSLINNLLILSINGFYIQYDQLKKLINYNKNYFTTESNIYGLNNNQFKNLIRDFRRLEDHYLNNNNNNNNSNNNNNNNSTSIKCNSNNIITNNHSSNNIINCNNNNEIISDLNSFKFNNLKINYSLYIIIDNNKKNINNKLIIDFNNNQTTVLFFKIWRNSVLKLEILNNIRLYNIHYKKRFNFKSMEELSNYKFKSYITSLTMVDNKYQIDSSGSNNNNNNYEKDELDILEDDENYYNNYNNGEINKIFKYNLPSNLLELLIEVSLESNYNYRIERMLPSRLTHIEFQNFNRPIPIGSFPLTLKSIIWGQQYNQPILPGLLSLNLNLEWIEFGFQFQQNINNNTIPSSVKRIYFNQAYSGTIYQVLPNCKTLEYRVYNSKDLQEIPKYCQTLEFININEHIHPNVIPASVTNIDFGTRFNLPIGLNSLPPFLRSLSFNKNYSQRIPFLSSTVTELAIGDYPPISWPSNLVKLKFGQFYNSTMEPLPRTLTHLDISEFSLKTTSIIPIAILPESLPSSIKYLKLCDYYNVAFTKNSLPNSLTTLILGSYYTQVIPPGALPNTLLHLDLGSSFNNSFTPSFLPSNLQTLTVGNSFNQDLAFKHSLPINLKLLIVMDNSSPILKYSYLPKSLNQIQCHKTNLNFINNLDLNITTYLLKFINKS